MRTLYGLNKDTKLPPLTANDLNTTANTEIRSRESIDSIVILPLIENKAKEMIQIIPIQDPIKLKEEVKMPPIYPKQETINLKSKINKSDLLPKEEDRFKTLQPIQSENHLEIEEESHDQIDGLLRWVQELPEEMSTNSPYSSTIKL